MYTIYKTEALAKISPPNELPKTIPKLKVLDCKEVATSFPVSTCLVTAVWNMVTSAPKAKINIEAVKAPRCSSTNFPAKITDTMVPIPNRIETILIPP